MKRRNNNFNNLTSRFISLVLIIAMIMGVSVMSAYADTLPDYPALGGHDNYWQIRNGNTVCYGLSGTADNVTITKRGYNGYYGGCYFSPYPVANIDYPAVAFWGFHGEADGQWLMGYIGNTSGVSQFDANVYTITPVSGCELTEDNKLLFTEEEFEFTMIVRDVDRTYPDRSRFTFVKNSAGGSLHLVCDWYALNDIYLFGEAPPPVPADAPMYYTYNVPYGSYLHIETPDGGTVHATVKTAKNVGSYISYPKFNGLRISYDNNNLNSYGYSRATNIALTPTGAKGNLGGASVFESDWLSVADSVNIYNGFDDEFSTGYTVQVTVYASDPKVVWYSPTTTSEVVSGDYSAVTNTGGAVNLSGGNGTSSSPYYVTPTNNEGQRVDYAEIGTNPQGNDITSSLAEQIISVITAPVQAMNDILAGSKDFMSALSGLYSWLPEELRAPVAGAFTTILTVGVIKVLL